FWRMRTANCGRGKASSCGLPFGGMHRLCKSARKGKNMRGRLISVLADQLDQGRADHHPICYASDSRCLFGRTDAETHRYRQVSRALDARDIAFDRVECCLLLAGYAGDRDVVEQAA